MLKISKKKVKTVYVLMYVFFAAGILMFIAINRLDSKLLAIPAVVAIGLAIYCNWWLKNTFRCPKCENTLLRAEISRKNRLVMDPLHTYDKYCSACGEEIKIEFTD